MKNASRAGKGSPGHSEERMSRVVPTEFVLFIPAHRDYDTKVQIL